MVLHSTLFGYSQTTTTEDDAFNAYTAPNTGSVSSVANLGPYAVAIDGQQFVINTSFEPYRREAFRHRSLPAQREAIMMTNIPGQGTVNTSGLWRREQTEWSMGAGQYTLDRKGDSQETRFYQSKGVDVFSWPLQATLLPDTYRKDSLGTVSSNLLMTRCGPYVVVCNGTTVQYALASTGTPTSTYSLSTVTVPAGSTWGTVTSVTSNDYVVYVASTTGLWYFTPGAGISAALYMANDVGNFTGGYDLVRWVNDQLIVSRKNRLYAVQPRSSSTYPFFGNPPSISDTSVNIASIVGNGTAATITTKAPHGFTVGQPVTVVNSRTQYYLGGNTATGISLNSGIATATTVSTINGTTAATHGLQVGESIYISGNQRTTCNGTFTVLSVTASTFTFNVNDNATALTGAGNTGGTVLGDTQAGFNVPYSVATVPSTTTFTVSSTVTDAIGPTGVIGAIGGTAVASQIPDMLYTHNNPNWIWSDATSGETQVYFAGYVQGTNDGYSGCVYRSDMNGASVTTTSGITTTTSGQSVQPWQLNTPIQALPMSPDEYPTCIESYLNYIFIGTNRGIRMAQTLSIYDPTATATGDLKSGPLIPNILQPVSQPVTAIVGDGRFVWFAWNNYDTVSTGLGKLDLSKFIAEDPLAPAYASDLMVTGQGTINSLDWDPNTNTPLIAVGGLGIYGPYATNAGGIMVVSKYVSSGNIQSGLFSYGIPDDKVPVYFDYGAYTPSTSSLSALITLDPNNQANGLSTMSVSSYANNSTISEFTLPTGTSAEQFSVNMTLTSGSMSNTSDSTPVMYRWTLKAWPAAVSGTEIMAVLQLYSVNVVDGLEVFQDPYAMFKFLEDRRQAQKIITYQEGPLTVLVVIDGMDWLPHKRRDNYENGFEGDCVVTLKTIGKYNYTSALTS